MKTIDVTPLGDRVQRDPSRAGKIARRVVLGLGYILALVLALLLGLPVVLLPSATSVPAPLWILLVIADVTLMILLFRLKPAWRGIAVSLLGVFVVSFLAILTSQFFARTPPILDSRGSPLPGSIAMLEKVNLNGSEQWISIRGKDVNSPVLLFLAGGPGEAS